MIERSAPVASMLNRKMAHFSGLPVAASLSLMIIALLQGCGAKGPSQSSILEANESSSDFTVVSYNVENLFDQTDDLVNSYYNQYRIKRNRKGYFSNYDEPINYNGEQMSFTDVKIRGIIKTIKGIKVSGPEIACFQEIESEESMAILFEEAKCINSAEDDDYLYALARISHLDNDPEKSKGFILKLLESSESDAQKFKATLGLANIEYSQGNYDEIPKMIEELSSFEPLTKMSERISLMIFLGNYYMGSGSSNDMAKSYFKKSMSFASSKTWTYFITRSLYGLACVADSESQNAELMWTLETLNSFVDESEQKYFSHLVNLKFQSYYTINTPIEFDFENKRIFIKDKWLKFQDKAMLFKFLSLLNSRKSFVEKKD